MAKRQPFDPSRVKVPDAELARPAGGAADRNLTVREVNELISGAIARHLPATLHVVGEISDYSRPASGHIYMTLKDAESELRCVMWRSAAASLKFPLQEGLRVVATGGIEVYSPRGSYQLIARRIEPVGAGAAELALRQLKEKLSREGLFDGGRKRPLPLVPERVGVVTSATGAAFQDIVRTISRRYPALTVDLFPARVQGDGAAAEIVAAIALAQRWAEHGEGLDVLIVGRGGGSSEDLSAFNNEAVARAIAASRVPVISAVGHEIDVTIADLVADVRAATPTAAAEMVSPDQFALRERVDLSQRRARRFVLDGVERGRAALERRTSRESLARPERRLRERAQWIDDQTRILREAWADRRRAIERKLDRAAQTLAQVAAGQHIERAAAKLDRLRERAGASVASRLSRLRKRLDRAAASVERDSPSQQWARLDERLAQRSQRMHSIWMSLLAARRATLDQALAALRAGEHQTLLRRGYAVVRDAATRDVIRSAKDVKRGQRLLTQLADGEIRSTADDPRQGRLFE